jgi:hypothetical protein
MSLAISRGTAGPLMWCRPRRPHGDVRFVARQGIVIRPWVECCHNNIWRPMDVAARKLGAKRIYRGQRLSEHYKSPIRSGTVVDGVEYVFPLEGWSEQQVFDYLRENDVEAPSYYEQTTTSLGLLELHGVPRCEARAVPLHARSVIPTSWRSYSSTRRDGTRGCEGNAEPGAGHRMLIALQTALDIVAAQHEQDERAPVSRRA